MISCITTLHINATNGTNYLKNIFSKVRVFFTNKTIIIVLIFWYGVDYSYKMFSSYSRGAKPLRAITTIKYS